MNSDKLNWVPMIGSCAGLLASFFASITLLVATGHSLSVNYPTFLIFFLSVLGLSVGYLVELVNKALQPSKLSPWLIVPASITVTGVGVFCIAAEFNTIFMVASLICGTGAGLGIITANKICGQ